MSLTQVITMHGLFDADNPLRDLSRSSRADIGTKRQKLMVSDESDRFSMSNYYFPTTSAEEEYHLSQTYLPTTMGQQPLPTYEPQQLFAPFPQQPFEQHTDYFQPPAQYQPSSIGSYSDRASSPWQPSSVPSHSYAPQQIPSSFPRYSESFDIPTEPSLAGSLPPPVGYLSPQLAARGRISRAASFTSNTSSAQSTSLSLAQSDASRSVSPNASEMAKWGFKNHDGSWSCAFPGCTSRSTFTRGCDLRKHYKRHSKSLFCRHDGCPQATEGGFSSKKDRARHEAKHNPTIVCEWDGCERLFSRQDNMKDHVRRVHRKRVAS